MTTVHDDWQWKIKEEVFSPKNKKCNVNFKNAPFVKRLLRKALVINLIIGLKGVAFKKP
jgi:hypothetical protein